MSPSTNTKVPVVFCIPIIRCINNLNTKEAFFNKIFRVYFGLSRSRSVYMQIWFLGL